jgi:hypothetical protein
VVNCDCGLVNEKLTIRLTRDSVDLGPLICSRLSSRWLTQLSERR